MKSASLLCNQPLDPIDANHIDIVKPDSPNATSYLAFVAAYNEQLPSAAAQLSPAQSSDNSCLPAKMLTTLTSPSIPTKDGDGTTVGTLTDVSLAIIEVCKPPTDRATRSLL